MGTHLDKHAFIALTAIAWADDRMVFEEAQAICRAAEACGISGPDLADIEDATRERRDLWTLDIGRLGPEQRRVLYAMGVVVAIVDGRVVDEETALLAGLADALQLSEADRERAAAAARAVAHLAPEVRPSRYDFVELARQLESVAA